MIAQNASNAIGSIVRIHKDGSIPNDNPYVNNPIVGQKKYFKLVFEIPKEWI